jgi:hypothetical protein
MELSIGYKTKKDRWDNHVRHVIQGDLWEGSLVCFAMNPQAVVTSVKQEPPASWQALAVEMRGFVEARQEAAAWDGLQAEIGAWLKQRTAHPSIEGQWHALAADMQRWLRRHHHR